MDTVKTQKKIHPKTDLNLKHKVTRLPYSLAKSMIILF